MRNKRTDELAQRLNIGWQQWCKVEPLDLPIEKLMAVFIGDMHATTNGRMIQANISDTTPSFHLIGEEQVYHFYFNYEANTWYCKA